MVAIPTNARTSVRVNAPADVEIHPWTIEFLLADESQPDLVRLYSIDGDPRLIILETNDREGSLTLNCYLGLHGTERAPAGSLAIEIDSGASAGSELSL